MTKINERARHLVRMFFSSVEDGRKALLADPSLIDERSGLGETVLHYLAVEDQLDAVKFLVEEKKAEVNTLNDFGDSPLSEAAELGHVELVKYLLEKGAMLKLKGQKVVLHGAVRGGNAEMVKILLAAGADVNEVGDLKDTALHVAAEWNEDDEISKLLLEAGADINARRLFDETPLDVAECNGASKIAAALRKASQS